MATRSSNWILLSIAVFFGVVFLGAVATRSGHADAVVPSKEVLEDPANVSAGEKTFVQNCAYCHGNQGSGGKAKTLQCRPKLTPDYVFETISDGRQSGSMVMPPWKDTFDEQTRWQLTSYILSLKAIPKCSSN